MTKIKRVYDTHINKTTQKFIFQPPSIDPKTGKYKPQPFVNIDKLNNNVVRWARLMKNRKNS